MNKKDLISIVITYYKKKKYLKKTLNSIFNQIYKNFEIILVYDDTKKDDLNYVRNLLKIFKNKKLIINKVNLGVSKSRNIALKNCKGDYIAFIDSDDLWKRNKLSDQITFMKKKSSFFSFTSYEIVDEFENVLKKRIVKKDAEYNVLMSSNFIGLSTVMFHKRILNKVLFPNLKTQEDFCLWLKLLKQNIRLHHYSRILTSWRKTNNSLSSNTVRKIIDAYKLFYIYQNKNFIFAFFSVIVLAYNKLKKNFLN